MPVCTTTAHGWADRLSLESADSPRHMGDGRTGERHTRHSPNELGHFIYLNRRAAAHHLFRWRAAVCRGLPFRPRSLDGRSTVPDSSSWDGQQAAHSGRRRVYKGWPALVALLGAPNMCTTLAVISGSFSSSMRCNGDMHERAAWSLDRGRLTCWSDAIGDWRDGRHGKGLRQVEREAKLKQSKRVAISLSVGRILPYCNPEFLTFAPPPSHQSLGGPGPTNSSLSSGTHITCVRRPLTQFAVGSGNDADAGRGCIPK